MSLSSSACFELGRQQGGKAGYVSKKFGPWLLKPFDSNRSIKVPLFGDVEIIEGCRPIQLIPPGSKIKAPDPEDLKLILDRLEKSGDTKDCIRRLFRTETSKGIFCISRRYQEHERLGYLAFLWACLDLEALGILDLNSGLLKTPTERSEPKMRRFAVPEPGNKVRIVTMSHASLSMFLQPFSHQML